MQFEFVPDPAWITMKAWEMWLMGVRIFLAVSVLLLVYFLIRTILDEEEDRQEL